MEFGIYTIQLATSSRAISRAARELDEDLRMHVVCVSQAKFHYAVQLAIISRACRRPARELEWNLVMEFGRVMEFGLRHAHDVHTQVFVQLASSSRTSLRPARELVASSLV